VGDDDDAATLGALLPIEGAGPDEQVVNAEVTMRLREALEALPERERRVIEARFGTGNDTRPLGLSRQEADAVQERALARLAEIPGLQALREAA
jgi:RNA polymerase primary sigma factor